MKESVLRFEEEKTKKYWFTSFRIAGKY